MGKIASHYVELSARVDKLEAAFEKTKKKSAALSGAFKKLGGVIAGAFAVQKVVQFGAESMKLAGQAEGVRAAFMALNDPNLLSEMQNATRGTISDLELMQSAVRAQNFKIPLEKLGTFFKFATDRAAQTGESVDYLVNSIIDGIGRKSTLVMDNLGISAAELQNEIKKTGDFGLAAGQIIEREMAKAGDVATTTAMKTARWGATIKNIQVTVGTGLNRVLNALAPLIDKAFKGLMEYLPVIQKGIVDVINYFIDLYNESVIFRGAVQSIWFAFKTMWENTKLVFKMLWESLVTSGKLIKQIFTGDFQGAMETWREGFKNLAEDVREYGSNTAQNFIDAYEATVTPRKKIEMIGFGEDVVKEAVASAQNAGVQVGSALTTALAPMQGMGLPGAGAPDEGGTPAMTPLGVMTEEMQGLKDKAAEALPIVSDYLTNFFEGFAGAFVQGENHLKQFLDYFKKWAIGIITQIAAIAAAALVLSLITGGGFSGFGQIFKGLFGKSGIGKMFGGFGDIAKFGKGAGSGGLVALLTGENIAISNNRYNQR